MGGATALLCLRRYPGLFDAAILSAPMLGIRTAGLPPALMRYITRLVRTTGLGICYVPGANRWSPDRIPTPERSRVSNDPERCRLQYAWFSADTALRVGAPTWGWLDTALRLTARTAKKEFLAGIDTPILLASAGIETFLRPEAHHRAARLLPDCTLVEFPESKHEPFLEGDAIRDRWFAAIDQFVAERLARTGRRAPAILTQE
jgi:lysophospholipase